MKFRYKTIMMNIAILALALCAMGFLIIYINFSHALTLQQTMAVNSHRYLEKTMEYQMLDSINNDPSGIQDTLQTISSDIVGQMSDAQTTVFVFYSNYLMYTNAEDPESYTMLTYQNYLPQDLITSLKTGTTQSESTCEAGHYYLYVAQKQLVLSREYVLITRRDITDIYQLLFRQLRLYVAILIGVLAICGMLMYLAGKRLTAPLEALNRAACTVAGGDYSLIDSVQTDDEFGELAAQFNRMTLAIKEQIQALQDMIHQREQFVADFTHEVKTPMTSIIGYADTLRRLELSEDNRQKAYDYIYSEGKRLESMSMKLFDLIYLREHDILRSEIATNELCAQAADSVGPLYEHDRVSLTQDVQHAVIYGDLELLKSVFINLLDNARKASNAGSCVEILGQETEDGYRFQIIDHGYGMNEETRKHICDEFYMADKSRSRAQGGAGLGMSLASLILNKHGFSLDIWSKENEGTIFTIEIPRPSETI